MAKIKLGLADLRVSEVRELGQRVITGLSTNAGVFPTPKPTVAQLTTMVGSLTTAIANVDMAEQLVKQRYTELATARTALENGLTEEAGYVESVAKGDATKINMAGMDVRAAAAPVGPLAKVLNLAATEGDHDGSVDLQWDRVRGARTYDIQTSTDGDGAWTLHSSCTKSAATVTGLTSGNKLWFRVRGLGAAGPGPWSDPATKVVP